MFLLLHAQTGAQEVRRGTGPFRLEVDHAVFSANDTISYVEIYYGLREEMLSYVQDSGKLMGEALMQLAIRNDSGIIASRSWRVPHALADSLAGRSGQTLMGIESLGLPPGKYRYTLVSSDIHDVGRRDSVSASLLVRNFSGSIEAVSDIELCSSIRQSTDRSSRFYKNTFEVVPNASKTFGTGLPILHYYCEVYNLAERQREGHVKLRAAVINATGREMVSHVKTKSRSFNSTVEVGTLNLSTVRSGTYILRVSVVDTTASPNRILAAVEKRFFVFTATGADSADSDADDTTASNEYDFMKAPQLDDAFDRVRYAATEPEIQQYERLTDLAGKRKFLADFWKRRDNDPSTPENEFKREYENRLEYADKNFSTPFRIGRKTDRGRVHVLYGPTDEIERYTSTSESLPYEIWHYYRLQGGVIFVFVDRNGLGEYNLVHSTHRNEMRDEQWFRNHAQRAR